MPPEAKLFDDLADNCALMLALGRIVLRSAELGETIDDVIRGFDSEKGKKSRTLMIGRKLCFAKNTAQSSLPFNKVLCKKFILLCDETILLIRQARNSPIHAIFLADDTEGTVIKWDRQYGPEVISIDDLNENAKKIKVATRRFRSFLHEIRSFQALHAEGT